MYAIILEQLSSQAKNDLIEDGNKFYLDTSNFRNSANNFHYITSTYILLEMINKKKTGIYLFLSKEIEDGKYVNGTEYFQFEKDKDDLGYKIKDCDVTLFVGNYGNEDLLYTSCGKRSASDEFVSAISKHFDFTPKLEGVVHGISTTGIALSDFNELVPENVVLPCGVDHINGARTIDHNNPEAFFVDYLFVGN